jgi:L-arabinose isomerase
VARNSRSIVDGLTAKAALPAALVFKPVVTTADAITAVCQDANNSPACIGLVMWMHTFSPAKMWIEGLTILQKPFVHLHTQFNRDIPWASIDMDYMNLHQSAHGDREFGFICTRMKKRRKVVVGHWEDASVQRSLALWMRVAAAWHDGRRLRVARFGDNMRDVAVTEGDKVEAQMRFGYTVSGYGVGDLVRRVREVGEGDVDRLVEEYSASSSVSGPS